MEAILEKWSYSEICKNPLQAKCELLKILSSATHEERLKVAVLLTEIQDIINSIA